MRLVVISDTHGLVNPNVKILKELDKIDLLLHLGDYTKDAQEIEEALGVDLIKVKGNCDHADFETAEEEILDIDNNKIFLTHGHLYDVKHGLNKLYYRAKELGATIVLFGHTHVPVSVEQDGILFFNPGSTLLSKEGCQRTYGIIDIGEKIESKIVEIA